MEWELLILAISYFVLGLDSLWIDWTVFKSKLRPKEVNSAEMNLWDEEAERKILVVIPAWKESNIIQRMLRGNLKNIRYENYRFVVGCYPNDMATCRSIFQVSKESPKVRTFINEKPGPTSKGQLLNRIVSEALSGSYGDFDLILFQDAEDIIHPWAMKLVNHLSKNYGFIQIPVFSFPIEKGLSAGAVYMEEFAESHTRDLLVRNHLKAALPSAGVGTALTKKALTQIFYAQKFQVFDESCLTEDYCLGIKAHELGIRQTFSCRYFSSKDGKKDWIATREYFPRSFKRSMRQKARWTQGIALESFQKIGWFGGLSNHIFLWRDRKAVLANSLGVLGLLNLPLLPFLRGLSPEFQAFLLLNGLLFFLRFFLRYQAFTGVYGNSHGLSLVLRYPLAILVNGAAGFLAVKNFLVSQARKQPSPWVKTDHEIPAGFGQVPVAVGRAL